MPDAVTALSLAKDFGVPIAAAALGALLAYVPATRLASRAAHETLARDRQQRADAELADTRRAFVKLALLANTVGSFRQQVEAMIAKADRDGNGNMPIHQRISTFAGIEHEPAITFGAAELAPFVTARRPDLMDELLLLQRRHAAMLHSLRAFAKLKVELHWSAAGHGTVTRDANLVSTLHARVPVEVANLLRAKAEELELFAKEMRRQLTETADHAGHVAAMFDEVATAHFGPGRLPKLEATGAEPAGAAA